MSHFLRAIIALDMPILVDWRSAYQPFRWHCGSLICNWCLANVCRKSCECMHWCIIHAFVQGVCYDSIDYKLQRGHQHIDSRSNSRIIVTHMAIFEGMYAPHHHLFRSIAWSMYLWARIFTANWWAYIHVSDVVICNCIDVASDASFHYRCNKRHRQQVTH